MNCEPQTQPRTPQTTSQTPKHPVPSAQRTEEVDQLGFLSECGHCKPPLRAGYQAENPNCLEALLSVLPALNQRPESTGKQAPLAAD
mgnify:CR=1 FL=1